MISIHRDRWGRIILRIVFIALLLCFAGARSSARADLFVSGQLSNNVLRYDESTGAFLGEFVPASGGGLNIPTGVSFGPDGNFYVANLDGSSVRRYDGITGAPLGPFALTGPFGFSLVFGPDQNLYLGSIDTFGGVQGAVLRFDGLTGASLGFLVPPGAGGLPEGICFGPDGDFYVGNLFQNDVFRYDGTTGAFLGTFVPAGSGGLNGPDGLVFGPDGNLYVSSFFGNSVLRYEGGTGSFLGTFATGGGLDGPIGLEFGPDGHLYVVSNRNSSVLRYDGTTGTFLGVVVAPGSGGLSAPVDLAFTPTAVPEPASLCLIFCSAISLAGYYRLTRPRSMCAAN